VTLLMAFDGLLLRSWTNLDAGSCPTHARGRFPFNCSLNKRHVSRRRIDHRGSDGRIAGASRLSCSLTLCLPYLTSHQPEYFADSFHATVRSPPPGILSMICSYPEHMFSASQACFMDPVLLLSCAPTETQPREMQIPADPRASQTTSFSCGPRGCSASRERDRFIDDRPVRPPREPTCASTVHVF